MATYTVGKLTAEDKAYFEKVNEGWEFTGETLTVKYDTGEGATYAVHKLNWTPYSTVRDCGDHYTHARYSDYAHIDKATMAVTIDGYDR